jgi:hypothetical protein
MYIYHATHFLKVSGDIANSKGKEFEQTTVQARVQEKQS